MYLNEDGEWCFTPAEFIADAAGFWIATYPHDHLESGYDTGYPYRVKNLFDEYAENAKLGYYPE